MEEFQVLDRLQALAGGRIKNSKNSKASIHAVTLECFCKGLDNFVNSNRDSSDEDASHAATGCTPA